MTQLFDTDELVKLIMTNKYAHINEDFPVS